MPIEKYVRCPKSIKALRPSAKVTDVVHACKEKSFGENEKLDLTWVIHVHVSLINRVRMESRALAESNCATRTDGFNRPIWKQFTLAPRVITLPGIHYVTGEINSSNRSLMPIVLAVLPTATCFFDVPPDRYSCITKTEILKRWNMRPSKV